MGTLSANDLLFLGSSICIMRHGRWRVTAERLRASGPFPCAYGVLYILASWLQGLQFTAAE